MLVMAEHLSHGSGTSFTLTNGHLDAMTSPKPGKPEGDPVIVTEVRHDTHGPKPLPGLPCYLPRWEVMRDTLAYLAAILIAVWGIAHAIPARQVVSGFEPTSHDNRLVVIQEWVAESFTMWGLAALVIVTTAAVSDTSTDWVYAVTAALLVAIALLTALTGARTRVVWFKICPMVLSAAALLLVAASLL